MQFSVVLLAAANKRSASKSHLDMYQIGDNAICMLFKYVSKCTAKHGSMDRNWMSGLIRAAQRAMSSPSCSPVDLQVG